jgi:hypothetical protein
MKNQIRTIIFLSFFLSLGFLIGCPVGGRCSYKDYPGTVTVKEIVDPFSGKEVSSSGDKNGERLFIKFDFIADTGGNVPTKVQRISDSVQITREEKERSGVAVGKTYRTFASYIETGTCSPGPDVERFEKWK